MPYFIRRNGKVSKPIDAAQFHKLKAAGKVLDSDEVSQSPNGPWNSLNKKQQGSSQHKLPKASDNFLGDEVDLNALDLKAFANCELTPPKYLTEEKQTDSRDPFTVREEEALARAEKQLMRDAATHLTVEHLQTLRQGNGSHAVAGTFTHIFLAFLVVFFVSIFCGCFAFIPCLYFAWRFKNRGENVVALIYLIAGIFSFFGGPTVFYLVILPTFGP